jgi:hypothetical protein
MITIIYGTQNPERVKNVRHSTEKLLMMQILYLINRTLIASVSWIIAPHSTVVHSILLSQNCRSLCSVLLRVSLTLTLRKIRWIERKKNPSTDPIQYRRDKIQEQKNLELEFEKLKGDL